MAARAREAGTCRFAELSGPTEARDFRLRDADVVGGASSADVTISITSSPGLGNDLCFPEERRGRLVFDGVDMRGGCQMIQYEIL